MGKVRGLAVAKVRSEESVFGPESPGYALQAGPVRIRHQSGRPGQAFIRSQRNDGARDRRHDVGIGRHLDQAARRHHLAAGQAAARERHIGRAQGVGASARNEQLGQPDVR